MERIDKIWNNFSKLKLKHRSSIKPFEDRWQEQEEIFEYMTKGFENNDLQRCRYDFEQLRDNSRHILQMMRQQNITIDEMITISEETLKMLNNDKILSIYRDWIADFIKKLRVRVDPVCWNRIQEAFSEKIRKKKIDFGLDYNEDILQFKNALRDFGINIEEYELLLRFKKESNIIFHKSSKQTSDDAKKLLDTFPDEYKHVKDLLLKIINILE
ncbi:hypothetical protein C1645_737073 [Glomus cerebriforme]|uniref:Uncharacterized protein n=1 Tax=Glomus cerebriforme TaxID=658196 RepID=A0A397SZJ7_9GLOM|nr:hypothetical protein C1645_737073 [Glomus cerebriforme]